MNPGADENRSPPREYPRTILASVSENPLLNKTKTLLHLELHLPKNDNATDDPIYLLSSYILMSDGTQ